MTDEERVSKTTFEAHVDRMELSKPPVSRGDSIRFWNAVCNCPECREAYVRVRVTVEVIEGSEER